MRFVHTADLHLGASFKGIGAVNADIAKRLRDATYLAFERVIDLTIEREASFLVIAGDVFDGAESPLKAQLFFREQLRRLDEKGILSFIIRGNHDFLSDSESSIRLPKSVTLFPAGSSETVIVQSKSGDELARVCGISYHRRDVQENLAKKLKQKPSELFTVALLHGSFGSAGVGTHERYAPFSVENLRSANIDYWALGHIHKPGVVLDESGMLAVYAGSAQGLNPKETGARGCYLVDAVSKGRATATFLPTAPISWELILLDADGWSERDQCYDAIGEALETIKARGGATLARIECIGRCALHKDLSDREFRRELAEHFNSLADANSSDFVWIEDVKARTGAVVDVSASSESKAIDGEIVRLASEAADSQELLAPVFSRTKAAGVRLAEDHIAEWLLEARDEALGRLLQDR